jgi:hypothetical protein
MTDPSDPGLRHAHAPTLAPFSPRSRFTPKRIAIQGAGAALGIAIFIWAVRLVLSPDNRAQLEALTSASAPLLALLAGLTIASVAVNGALFWIAVRPLRELRLLDIVAVNAIATFLSVLPFKLNLILRVLIHHRRDGVPFRDLIAWLAAVAALGLAGLVPLAGASLWRGRLDALWWTGAITGLVIFGVLAVVLGRLSENNKWLATTSLGSWRIVRHPGPVVSSLPIRLIDVGLVAARFLVVAEVIGVALSPSHAVVLATLWFALSVAAPTGTLGYREGLLVVVGSGGLDEGAIATLAIGVLVAELAVSGVLALAGAAWLRLDRLLLTRSLGATPTPTNPEVLDHPDAPGR